MNGCVSGNKIGKKTLALRKMVRIVQNVKQSVKKKYYQLIRGIDRNDGCAAIGRLRLLTSYTWHMRTLFKRDLEIQIWHNEIVSR